MILSAIVAVGPGGEIGHKGGLPWPRLRKDMQRFYRITTNAGVVIMGRKTWESFQPDPALNLEGRPRYRPLEGRANFTLSADPAWRPEYYSENPDTSVDVYRYPAELLDYLENQRGGPEAVVIGGRDVYGAFWDRLDRIYLTKVDPPSSFRLAADTYFPHYPLPTAEWDERPVHDRFFVDRPSGIRMGFLTYERRR